MQTEFWKGMSHYALVAFSALSATVLSDLCDLRLCSCRIPQNPKPQRSLRTAAECAEKPGKESGEALPIFLQRVSHTTIRYNL
jgi:hypothetical protein